MAKWIEYTGSDEQLEALANAKTAIRVRYINGTEVNWHCILFKQRSRAIYQLQDAIAYLISEPHPYADIIKIWADTGCEVWIKPHKPYSFKISDYENNPYAKLLVNEAGVIIVTTKPDWNIPGAEYRLTPFDDRKE